MSRVSENSSTNALNYAVGRAKQKLEDLQLKGTTLKRLTKPSDDPVGNVEMLSLKAENVDIDQYGRAATFAKTHLEFTETAIQDLTEIVTKAKELAIGQASDLYSPDIRRNVAKEIGQMHDQAVSIANRKLGNRYVFAGHNTLSTPFDKNGNYSGDDGRVVLEVGKDNYAPINLTGREVFYGDLVGASKSLNQLQMEKDTQKQIDSNKEEKEAGRALASASPEKVAVEETGLEKSSIFSELKSLENALLLSDTKLIQDLLPKLDASLNRLISLRTKVGAISGSIESAETASDRTRYMNEIHRSKVQDADIAELFSDIVKQQNILKATYKAGSNVINHTLLDFLR